MVGSLPGESSHNGSSESGPTRGSLDRQGWYFTRKEIEESSPSRRDGIDLKKEAYLRKSYCTYLQDLGMRLKVPQVTIATAVIFCHRFFIRQSHAKNDRRTIATVCMFLAGKVEETPRGLKELIMVSYEIINKKEPDATQRIKQKDVYEQQKDLILVGERVLLATLGFDLNVHHPYKPLVEAIKKFKVAQNALAQVAWNFVNDGLRTSLCLQFMPHHIAAGAIFLAAKFLKVKLPSDGEKVWWQEFDVTPRQLEEVSNQMLELYEQNRVPPSQGSEVEGSAAGGGGPSHRPTSKTSAGTEEQVSKHASSSQVIEQHSHADDHHGMSPTTTRNQSTDMGSVITGHKVDQPADENQQTEQLHQKENTRESSSRSRDRVGDDSEAGEWRADGVSHNSNNTSNGLIARSLESKEGPIGNSPREPLKIDKTRLKAVIEKRRKVKERAGVPQKKDLIDDDDLIERELENGVEMAVEERKQSCPKIEENTEEGEMLNNASPLSHKRKVSPPDRQFEGKKRQNPDDGHKNSWS
ncbi:hypothetical protein ACFE04_012351 [Oxalis oulophora]